MPGVVEIARFPSSEAYQKDPSIINPALELLTTIKGSHEIFHGLQVEDKKTLYLLVIWDRLEDHKNFINDPVAYPLLAKLLGPSVTAPAVLLHVPFTSDPLSPFRAPITEFVYASVNAELSATVDIKEVDARLQAVSDKRLGTKHGAALGRTIENDGLSVGTLGWDSVQEHIDWVTIDPEGTAVVGKFKEVTSIVLEHVPLKAFS
ncbi:hypothetical protein C8Q75DRAFT_772966 [Abortiporus biennis]|nr:hypothetical protein C8Q75DRAFT_772966 [Abortiporus biennis]